MNRQRLITPATLTKDQVVDMRALAIVAACLLLGSTAPGQSPDFSGSWTMDRSKSESQLPIPDLTLLITQAGLGTPKPLSPSTPLLNHSGLGLVCTCSSGTGT